MLERFKSFLDQHQRFLLTTHENPDGDGVGAALGLAHHLRAQQKEVRIVVFPSLAENLRELDPERWIEAFDPEGIHRDLANWPDAWVLIDASEPHRLGAMHPLFENTKAIRVCLDHHLKDAPQGFDDEFTDPSASASAELVFDLIADRQSKPWPLAQVRALYAGMEPARTFQALYHTDTPQKIRLWGRVMEGLRLLEKDRFALLTVRQTDLSASRASYEDLDELVQQPMRLRGVEVGALATEMPDGRVKLSLRSKERVNVNAVCRRFGGGGHRLASGAKLEGPLESALSQLEAAMKIQMEEDLA
jgi:nanoRNase/pAp phosphatase (c-di-AMP/oligoRNAs hydrolase)